MNEFQTSLIKLRRELLIWSWWYGICDNGMHKRSVHIGNHTGSDKLQIRLFGQVEQFAILLHQHFGARQLADALAQFNVLALKHPVENQS